MDRVRRKVAMRAIREADWNNLAQPTVKLSPHPIIPVRPPRPMIAKGLAPENGAKVFAIMKTRATSPADPGRVACRRRSAASGGLHVRWVASARVADLGARPS
jgi:hypothetical protein